MHVTTTQARADLSSLVNRAARRGERIVVQRRGRDVAAIVSLADLALIEKVEDEIDVREARKVLAAMKRKGEGPISLAQLERELGS